MNGSASLSHALADRHRIERFVQRHTIPEPIEAAELTDRGGKEILYRKGDAVLSVSFDPASGDVGTPALLFRKRDAGRLSGSTIGYDVAPDGSRFLLVVPVEQAGARATTVVLHWLDRLGRDRP